MSNRRTQFLQAAGDVILMSVVHSASFSQVRRRTSFLHYESLEMSTFQELSKTPEFTTLIMIPMSVTFGKF